VGEKHQRKKGLGVGLAAVELRQCSIVVVEQRGVDREVAEHPDHEHCDPGDEELAVHAQPPFRRGFAPS
jgi:hypothetical protein